MQDQLQGWEVQVENQKKNYWFQEFGMFKSHMQRGDDNFFNSVSIIREVLKVLFSFQKSKSRITSVLGLKNIIPDMCEGWDKRKLIGMHKNLGPRKAIFFFSEK